MAAFFRELLGLFVEDGGFALAIVAVVIVAGLSAVLVPTVPMATGAILLLGCLGVLVMNVMRARRR